ncbi:hypothetical protein Hanom_Chr06g00519221 [Helianthus anomalus]
MQVVESSTITPHTSQHEPYINGFPRSTVMAPQPGNAASGTFGNNSSHLTIPFCAENGERKLKPEQEM